MGGGGDVTLSVDVSILFSRCQPAGRSIGCSLPTCRLAAILVARRMRSGSVRRMPRALGRWGPGYGGSCTRLREPVERRAAATFSSDSAADPAQVRASQTDTSPSSLTRSCASAVPAPSSSCSSPVFQRPCSQLRRIKEGWADSRWWPTMTCPCLISDRSSRAEEQRA